MKQKHNAGFSLIEVLVAIVLLGTVVVPTCTSLVLATKMNDQTAKLMNAQLAVSSAIETLMAEGIKSDSASYTVVEETKTENGVEHTEITEVLFPEVTVKVEAVEGTDHYYKITAVSEDDIVTVTTTIRDRELPEPTEPPEETVPPTEDDGEEGGA